MLMMSHVGLLLCASPCEKRILSSKRSHFKHHIFGIYRNFASKNNEINKSKETQSFRSCRWINLFFLYVILWFRIRIYAKNLVIESEALHHYIRNVGNFTLAFGYNYKFSKRNISRIWVISKKKISLSL